MLGGNLPRTRLFWIGAGILVVVLAVAAVIGYRISGSDAPPSVPFSDFVEDANAKQLRRVTVDGDTLIAERW